MKRVRQSERRERDVRNRVNFMYCLIKRKIKEIGEREFDVLFYIRERSEK